MTERLPINKQIISRTHELFRYETNTDNYQKGINLVKKGKIPILIFNHQSLSDAMPAIRLSEDFMKTPGNQIQGVDIVVADSLPEKRQSQGSKKAFEIFSEYIEDKKDWLSLLPVSYINDKKRKFHPLALLNIINAPSKNRMLIIYPEGRTEGGRKKDKYGNPKSIGMIQAQNIDRIFKKQIEKNHKNENNFFVWPIAIIGSHEVFSPDDYSFPPDFLENLYSDQSLKPLAEVKFGQPIMPEELSTIEDKTSYIMVKIAEISPEIEPGFYNPKNFRINLDNL